MIKFDDYKVRDDGMNKLDMKLRSALRTINAKPKRYFKYFNNAQLYAIFSVYFWYLGVFSNICNLPFTLLVMISLSGVI